MKAGAWQQNLGMMRESMGGAWEQNEGRVRGSRGEVRNVHTQISLLQASEEGNLSIVGYSTGWEG